MRTNVERLCTLLIGLLFVAGLTLGYWQVFRGPGLSAAADNPRRLEEAARSIRGGILDRNGVALAASELTAEGVKRHYALPAASPVTGYYSGRYGNSGIEAAYDDFLRGQRSPDALERLRAELLNRRSVGSDVVLTIDARVQAIAADAIGDAAGAIVALDPRSGAVLALASRPYYDPNAIDRDWQALTADPGRPLFNRALQATYVPGSTFKTVTAAAAIDLGLLDVRGRFACTTPLRIDELSVDCRNHSHLPVVDFNQAYAWSCNRTHALVALGLGFAGPLELGDRPARPYPWSDGEIDQSVAKLYEYAERFGFERETPFDLPVEVSRLADPGQRFFPSLLAQTGFGQGQVAATPLEMALVASTIANGGVVPRPYLASEARAPSGATTVMSRGGGQLGRAVSVATAAHLNRMMQLSVDQAYAQKAQIDGVIVAGKTGTAEVGEGRQPHAWFIGYAPANDPRVAVAVILENKGSGADFAAPAAHKVLSAALAAYQPGR